MIEYADKDKDGRINFNEGNIIKKLWVFGLLRGKYPLGKRGL